MKRAIHLPQNQDYLNKHCGDHWLPMTTNACERLQIRSKSLHVPATGGQSKCLEIHWMGVLPNSLLLQTRTDGL